MFNVVALAVGLLALHFCEAESKQNAKLKDCHSTFIAFIINNLIKKEIMENINKWEEMAIPETRQNDNYIIQSLPKSFNEKHGVKFHYHEIINNTHQIKYVELKHEIIKKGEMFFLKLFTDNFDFMKIQIHFFIVTETDEMIGQKKCSCGSNNTENYQLYCNDCKGAFDAV